MASFYWINAKGDQAGPIEQTNAVGLVKTGMITAETLVWTEGMANWAPAKSAPVLGDFFRAPRRRLRRRRVRPPMRRSFNLSIGVRVGRRNLSPGRRRRGRAA